MEGEGSSETECYTEIETNTTDSLNNSIIFHVIKNILGFILYMHQQIPAVLQDLSLEFDSLKQEYGEMTTAAAEQTEAKASIRRQHISRRREVRIGIKRFEKLMNAISGIETALKLIITENPKIESFILILGATPLRPLQVYELSFLHGSNSVLSASNSTDFATNKAAEALARKAVRALITNGAGSGSYPGPSKLFLLVKAPSSFNLPLHFLPKRDFKYSKKIVPVRLRVKCKSRDMQVDAPDCARQNSSSISLRDSLSEELIWFQCRHVVRGIACATQTEE